MGVSLRHYRRYATRVALATILFTAPLHPQPLSLSPTIDTLQARLLRSPEDASLRTQLIDAYILAFEPELALLEILSTPAGRADAGIRGRIQFSLEQLGAASRSLRQAYIAAPLDETLVLLAVVAYAEGNSRLGFWELQRLKGRSPSLAVDLLGLYERFYLYGRTTIASAAQRALQEVDPVAFETYFPRPQISILSPQDGMATEAPQVSVIWEVRHSRPLASVRIGSTAVFEGTPDGTKERREQVQRSFSRLVPVQEGRNDIILAVEDMFGNRSRDTVVVHGLNFDRRPDWRAPLVDSLRSGLEFVRTFVPDSVFSSPPVPGKRAMVLAGPAGRDSLRLFHRAVFLHEFLSNPLTGETAPEHAKLLAGHRVTGENVAALAENWLLKGATFQSITLLYLAGEWSVSDDAWNVRDVRGNFVNMRPWLFQLRALATAGFVLVFDGVVDNREGLERDLRDFVAGSSVPINAVVLPQGEAWDETIPARSTDPDASASAPFFTGADLSPSSAVINSGEQLIPLARNPSYRIRHHHADLQARLRRKLEGERIEASAKERILDFSEDWRRYNEITRYLSGTFSLQDFLVRVEEYMGKTGGRR